MLVCETEAKRWYAVHVRPHHERVTERALAWHEITGYLPTYRSRRRWSDRTKEVEQPIFPGYLFCRITLAERGAVMACPGVYSIVGTGAGPVAVEESQIEAIRRMQSCGAGFSPHPYLKTGQRVRIESGPLAGLEGVLASAPDSWRVVVSVELLQRSVAVTVDRRQVTAIRQASAGV